MATRKAGKQPNPDTCVDVLTPPRTLARSAATPPSSTGSARWGSRS